MKAIVYGGKGIKEVVDKEKPKILKSTDAIVKLTKTTICGTDLHIIKGDTPEVKVGTTLGHEGVGIIESVGDGVTHFKVGDSVLISCITRCGKCDYCAKGLPSHCMDGGWILGHLIDGTQAEYVRIPHADTSLYHIPEKTDEEALVMLSDILPTSFEIGVLASRVKPGDNVAIVGSGPIGLSAAITSAFYSPAKIIMIDVDDNRLEMSKKFGVTHTINSSKKNLKEEIMKLTDNLGVDIAMEAVGIKATFEDCQKIVGVGGHIANIGVHGTSAEIHLEDLWIKNITISAGLVNATSTPMLLKTVMAEKLEPKKFITHHFSFNDILKAYESFSNPSVSKALKVIIEF